jgi:hypothetical protein
MPTNNEIAVFHGSPVPAALPRLQVGTGEVRTLIFRVYDYGGRGIKDLSGVTGIALTSKPVLSADFYPSVFAAKDNPLADWEHGKVAVEVGPANVTNAETLLAFALVQLDAAGHAEVITQGLIEVQAVPALAVGALGFPHAPTDGTTKTFFTFTQTDPLDTWTIVHNLGGIPCVVALDLANIPLVGNITYPDLNTLVITFTEPKSGTAYLN